MIGIINYGHGNIGSIENALSKINFTHKVITNPEKLTSYTHLILPGVGSFSKCMDVIQSRGWGNYLKASVCQGVRLLGICLGMQLLFDTGEEDGKSKGLGFINGNVKIGFGSFIGSGAIIREGIELPPYTIIGAGKVIMGWPQK